MLESGDTIWGIAREVLHQQGNPRAYDTTDMAVNRYINQVMVPRMWSLNSHLHSNGAWNCPACSIYNPNGTINMPPAWARAFQPTLAPSPTPMLPPITPPPFPPPVPTPGPVYPPPDCNKQPLGPVVYKVGPVDIILFPEGVPENLPPPLVGYENYYAAQTATGIGVLLDVVEAAGPFYPYSGVPEIAAFVDLGVAGAGSIFAGETYIGQPHPNLPTMAVFGQDVIVASAETAVGTIGKWALTAGGVASGNPAVAIGGAVGGVVVDTATSASQAVYDAGRFFEKIPTIVSAGLYLDDRWPPRPRAAFMFYQP